MYRFLLHSIFTRVILLTLLAIPSMAQLNSANITQYTELNGVPGAQVNRVLVDKWGYIWIGTINGLARYDGYEFKRFYFNPNDSTTIHGLIVWSIYQDRKDQIWIATSPSFLNVYTPATQTFRRYDFSELITRPANIEVGISDIREDKKGRIWLGISSMHGETISTGLLFIDENDNKIEKFPLPDSLVTQNVYSMVPDREGNIWILSYGGVFKIDSNRKIGKVKALNDYSGKTGTFYSDLLESDDGHLWLMTNESDLCDYDPVLGSIKSYSPGKPTRKNYLFNKIIQDKDKKIWMGTNTGLFIFDPKAGQFETFRDTAKLQLTTTPINDLKIDLFGTLWVATQTEGLLKYEDRAILKSYSHNKLDKNSLTQGWANSFIESHDGKIWITTAGLASESGINELDPQTGKIQPYLYKDILPKIYGATGLFETSPGEFLVATDAGPYDFIPKMNLARKANLKGLPEMVFINQFYKDSRGDFWVATQSGLFRQAKGTDFFKKYDLSSVKGGDASSNEVTRVYESSIHGLWLATNNGLFIYDYASDKIVREGYDKNEGDIFITQDINSFYEDQNGIAWVGTWQGGLSRYDVQTKKIKTYTLNDGLPSMSIQGILGDEKHEALWLSTFDGLCRFNVKTAQCNNFSIADGIQSQLFADGATFKTSSGLFCFGGSNGITLFNPDNITKNSIPPRVMLTDLKLFDKSVIPGEKSILKEAIYDTKEITLAHNQNNISLEFLAIHYSNPSKNRYAYKLENYDNEWREVGSQHIAFYPKLPPGEYLFRVKAANNNGVWNEQGASLKIIVLPPWWLTRWAYGLYILLLALLGFAGDRYLRDRLVKKERERSRIKELEQAREIEKAYTKLEQAHESLKSAQAQLVQSEKMASLGELTAGIAHEIQNPLNFVNNFSEVNEELLQEMKEAIATGKLEEAKTLAKDLEMNMEKINNHGRRADAIVKSMLEHSRIGAAQKEPADLNALCDEYLRLSYHGMRARDNNFKAHFESQLDIRMGNVKMVAQDIGRVLLNLFNNAFYAVREKTRQVGEGYSPSVMVSTFRKDNWAEIRIKDNGMGIPEKIKEKIFQPFFTTKPTGQGTGLGLSLSYDIITKGHGGELRCESREGVGTEFILRIPIT